MNFEVTKLLDQQNALFNGVPQLTQIPVGLHPGPAVLVTGHDLVDLRTLLEKCETRGVNVYTHGEMLPSFMYPELKSSSASRPTSDTRGSCSRANSPASQGPFCSPPTAS